MIFSDNFGYDQGKDTIAVSSFYLIFIPKLPNWNDGTHHKLELGFNVLPQNVKTINCMVKLSDGKEVLKKHSVYSLKSWYYRHLSGNNDINEWFQEETIFVVTIEITEVINLKDEIIEKSDWKWYGIE